MNTNLCKIISNAVGETLDEMIPDMKLRSDIFGKILEKIEKGSKELQDEMRLEIASLRRKVGEKNEN